MTEEFKVLFSGRIINGFDAPEVRAKAGRRLKASPEQIGMLFSGRTSVLKKGISRVLAERYVTELRAIGMEVLLDPSPSASEPTPVRQAPPVFVDMEKTQLADPGALAAYLNESNQSYPALAERDTALIERAAMMRAELPDELPGAEDSAEPEIAAVNTLVANPNALSRYVSNAGHFEPMALMPEPIPTPARQPTGPVVPAGGLTGSAIASAAPHPAAPRSDTGVPGPFGAGVSNVDSLKDELSQRLSPPQESPATSKKLVIGAAIILIFALAWWLL